MDVEEVVQDVVAAGEDVVIPLDKMMPMMMFEGSRIEGKPVDG